MKQSGGTSGRLACLDDAVRERFVLRFGPEVAAWCDALPGVSDHATLERRIETLASMVPGLSPERVLGWCRAMAVLFAAPRARAGRDDAETRFLAALAA